MSQYLFVERRRNTITSISEVGFEEYDVIRNEINHQKSF